MRSDNEEEETSYHPRRAVCGGQISPADLKKIADLGLKNDFDLRTAEEREAKPGGKCPRVRLTILGQHRHYLARAASNSPLSCCAHLVRIWLAAARFDTDVVHCNLPVLEPRL
jgi:hypothetical protein